MRGAGPGATSNTTACVTACVMACLSHDALLSLLPCRGQVDYEPSVCQWAFSPIGGQPPLVCVADNGSGTIRVYNADGEGEALTTVTVHRAPVKAMAFNLAYVLPPRLPSPSPL